MRAVCRPRRKTGSCARPGAIFFGQSLGQHDEHSWIGGAQAGCDYQFAGGFVIGVQGDYAWTNAEGSHDSAREIGARHIAGEHASGEETIAKLMQLLDSTELVKALAKRGFSSTAFE